MPARDTVDIVGPADGTEGYAVRDFLTRIDQPYSWLEPESEQGRALLSAHRREGAAGTVVVVDGATVLESPSLEALADAIGIRYAPSRREYDLIVIGAGPAGLAAAVSAASDGLRTVVAERGAPGGQAAYTSRIENYFGLDPDADPMTGARLARIGGRQAEAFGAELLILRGVVGGGGGETPWVALAGGEELHAEAVICATGIEWRRLSVPGLDKLVGNGVFYAAGRSEAPRFRGRRVAIVGAGNAAGQAALNFAAYAERVTMLCRGATLGASLSRYLVERIEREPRIDVRMQTSVRELHADGRLHGVTVLDATGGRSRIPIDGLFVAIGGAPQTQWAEASSLRRDEAGYLVTGPDLLELGRMPEGWPLERLPLALESSIPGFFIAGDVRHGSTKRVSAAVGEGAMAVSLVHRYLEERRAA